jgi:Ig-like domain from next to BRCA1 gene
MNTKRRLNWITFCFIVTVLGLSSCKLLSSVYQPQETRSIFTLVAETIAVESTLSSGQTAVARLTQMASGSSATSIPVQGFPSSTASPTFTAPPPTATPVPPSATPLLPIYPTYIYPTYMPIPPIYPTYVPIPPVYPTPFPIPPAPPLTLCDWSQYVKDVTIPDGTVLSPGEKFTKVWRLRNIGSCTWTSYYSLIFTSGSKMQGHGYVPLHNFVYPGQTVDIAVDLVAPLEPGHYRGYWMLSNSYGQAFGIGDRAQKAFWVDIQVESNVRLEYDFIDNVCDASWRNESHHLPCPGNEFDPRGSIVLLDNPILETGEQENEAALWMRPQATHDGTITGLFTEYKVHPGDRFMADIGCLVNNPGCDVIFRLDYQIDGQAMKHLGSWREVYDGEINRLVVDLSSLAGETVHFILQVENKGNPAMANAIWLAPSIQRSPPIQ